MFILLQRLLPHHLISRLVGLVANCETRWVKDQFIRWIIQRFDVDLTEAERESPADYRSFNDFFTRTLKPGVRPILGPVCSPADGEVSAAGNIEDGMIFQAKGINYSLKKLLANTTSSRFSEGSFITVYLAPRDYHRVHCPVSGTLIEARYIPGRLFSVNQVTAQNVPDLFAINERLIMDFETSLGPVSVVMVGAMIVAAIQPVWRDTPYPAGLMHNEQFTPGKTFQAGDELGLFQMGSTAIVLFDQRQSLKAEAGDRVMMGESLLP